MADYSDKLGLAHQGDEVSRFIAFLYPNLAIPTQVSIVAHSTGGLAARDFLTRFAGATQRVAELITYGTPHRGADVDAVFNANRHSFCVDGADPICLHFSQSSGALDARFKCAGTNPDSPYYPGRPADGQTFLQDLSGKQIPSGIRYTSALGVSTNNDWPLPDGERNGGQDDCHSAQWDGLVPRSSADLAQADAIVRGTASIRTLTTNQTHMGQGNDFPTILCALDSNCTMFRVLSPVDIDVIAPDTTRIGPTFTGIPGASYMKVVEDSGHETATILIPYPIGGQYTVKAFPKPGALPTDTFTITQTQNGVTTTFAKNMKIQDIPAKGFHPHVNSAPMANAGPDQTLECRAPSGTPTTLNGSGSKDPDGDKLAYQWTDAQGNVFGKTPIAKVVAALGTQAYSLTVTDSAGAVASTQTHVTVRDTTKPFAILSVSPRLLWPANGQLIPIKVTLLVQDQCDPNPTVSLVSIKSNDPADDVSDIQGAAFGTDDRSFSLRARQPAKGVRRVYTVTYRVTDHSGNSTTVAGKVYVPRDNDDKCDD